MPDLPSATTTIEAQAGAVATGVDTCVVIAACSLHADAVPRVFSSWEAVLEQHGYCDGVDYAAMHIEETKKPIQFVGLPIATAGAITAVVVVGNTGTSVASVAAAAGGTLGEHDGAISVVKGGTVGTSEIKLAVSLDGGRTRKPLRLGTANTYTIPYIGVVLSLAAGTLIAGETIITWHGSGPRWNQAGLQAARVALAAQMKPARSWLVIGDLATEDDAGDVATEANAYETVTDRFVFVRTSLLDRSAIQSKAQHIAAADAEFADVDAQKRIDIGFGRGRKNSRILGYRFRRSVQWAASIREYQHDVHIPTWRKEDGPLLGWDLEDAEGSLVEHDERVDGGALAARFTCFRTYANGPAGAFIAMSLTRDVEGNALSLTHNMAVANIACTVNQAATEAAIGQSLILNPNGTATADALAKIENRVNTQLSIALLQDKGEGQRASLAFWTASTTDDLSQADAELTGVLSLFLRGTLVKISTRVRINSAG